MLIFHNKGVVVKDGLERRITPNYRWLFLPELNFSLKTIGVIYFWKAGDTRMSEIKFGGTTGTTGTRYQVPGTRYQVPNIAYFCLN